MSGMYVLLISLQVVCLAGMLIPMQCSLSSFTFTSAATVEIIDTTQPEEIIIDPPEGMALEM